MLQNNLSRSPFDSFDIFSSYCTACLLVFCMMETKAHNLLSVISCILQHVVEEQDKVETRPLAEV